MTNSRKATPISAGPASASWLETVMVPSTGTEETSPPSPKGPSSAPQATKATMELTLKLRANGTTMPAVASTTTASL